MEMIAAILLSWNVFLTAFLIFYVSKTNCVEALANDTMRELLLEKEGDNDWK